METESVFHGDGKVYCYLNFKMIRKKLLKKKQFCVESGRDFSLHRQNT